MNVSFSELAAALSAPAEGLNSAGTSGRPSTSRGKSTDKDTDSAGKNSYAPLNVTGFRLDQTPAPKHESSRQGAEFFNLWAAAAQTADGTQTAGISPYVSNDATDLVEAGLGKSALPGFLSVVTPSASAGTPGFPELSLAPAPGSAGETGLGARVTAYPLTPGGEFGLLATYGDGIPTPADFVHGGPEQPADIALRVFVPGDSGLAAGEGSPDAAARATANPIPAPRAELSAESLQSEGKAPGFEVVQQAPEPAKDWVLTKSSAPLGFRRSSRTESVSESEPFSSPQKNGTGPLPEIESPLEEPKLGSAKPEPSTDAMPRPGAPGEQSTVTRGENLLAFARTESSPSIARPNVSPNDAVNHGPRDSVRLLLRSNTTTGLGSQAHAAKSEVAFQAEIQTNAGQADSELPPPNEPAPSSTKASPPAGGLQTANSLGADRQPQPVGEGTSRKSEPEPALELLPAGKASRSESLRKTGLTSESAPRAESQAVLSPLQHGAGPEAPRGSGENGIVRAEPALSTAHLDAGGPEEARGVEPAARSVAVKIGDSKNGTASVLLTDRGGQVQVTVRSADPSLTQSLQGELGSFTRGLEQQGYQVRVWHPSSPASADKHSGSNSGDSFGREHFDGQAHQRQYPQDGRQGNRHWQQWLEEIE